MHVETSTPAHDLARAEERVRRCRADWERHGFRSVTDAELSEAEAHLAECAGRLAELGSPGWRAVQFQFALYWLIERTRVGAFGWRVGAFLVATASVVLSAVPLVLLLGRLIPIFIWFAALFFASGAVAASVLSYLEDKDLREELLSLRDRLTIRKRYIVELEQRLKDWRSHLGRLRQAADAERAYRDAESERIRLIDLLRSRRYRLARCDWRSLRATGFEDFVAEVFEELGFSVRKTKTSGDQGVDLIVEGRGRLIAVQTKGYEGSVGNKAIQEVYAGMVYYRCRECLAVTNSVFTPAAIDLARSVGCALIDGAGIPPLIEGHF